jgi:hypothetical protein
MLKVIGYIVGIIALCALCWWVWMLAWNYVMPYVFGLPAISYWQGAVLFFIIGSVGQVFRANINIGK